MIVIVAVTAAMVVPSITNVSQGNLKDESNRLRLVLAYALEEAQLSGYPIRWRATKDGWSFEAYLEDRKQSEDNTLNKQGILDKKMTWQPLGEKPLEEYILPQSISITRVEQAGEFFTDALFGDSIGLDDRDKEPSLGVVLLLPDGTTSQSNVYLQDEEKSISVLEIRPGPSGIKLKKEDEY